jgi:beta-N-acetylhexosaminidase
MTKSSHHQQIGQRFMIGIDSTRLDDELKYAIASLHVGGIILFARNLQDPEQMTALCQQAQEHAARCGQPPLFIAIDQEGGQVARLKPPFTQFPHHPPIRSIQEAFHFAEVTAQELKQIGVNMNMAPVLDVLPPQGPSVMEKRSFSRDPQKVAELGVTLISQLQARGVMAVCKHFPGIGRTVLDSHQELPDLYVDLASLRTSDLIPFAAAVENGVAGIMLSHIRYGRLDDCWPASLSPAIAVDLLRRGMGYAGLVLTDDLDMGAVAKHYKIDTVVAQCLAAEVDIALICHPGPNISAALDAARSRIAASKSLQQKHEASLKRIKDAKERFLV